MAPPKGGAFDFSNLIDLIAFSNRIIPFPAVPIAVLLLTQRVAKSSTQLPAWLSPTIFSAVTAVTGCNGFAVDFGVAQN
jgi:hypothetical protein